MGNVGSAEGCKVGTASGGEADGHGAETETSGGGSVCGSAAKGAKLTGAAKGAGAAAVWIGVWTHGGTHRHRSDCHSVQWNTCGGDASGPAAASLVAVSDREAGG